MFKLGGQADQGSGIMSHVEPRQNYMFGSVAQPLTPFQTAYADLPIQGYAMGGRIGYAQAGPVMPGTLPTVKSPYPVFGREQALESMYGKDAIENAYKKEVDKYKQNILGIQNQMGTLSQDPESGVFLPGAEENIAREEQGLAKLLTPEGKRSFETRKIEEFNRLRKQEGLASLVQKEEPKTVAAGDEDQEIKTKDYTTEEGKTTDPRNAIRKEADMLKELLKDEGLTTAENALIVAKALATPGGFNAKVQAAADLALPIMRQRSKLDKEVVLEAYKTSKEIEKAKIAAGKKSAQQEILEESVQAQLNVAKKTKDPVTGETLYNGKTRDQIRNQVYSAYTQKIPYAQQQQAAALKKSREDAIARLTEEAAKKGKQPDQRIIDKYKGEIEQADKLLSGQLYAKGGRVKKQLGGMSDETQTETDTQTSDVLVDTNVEGVPERPVQKLSFEEIRTRLPREITDDIVRLISNSAEALQDFSYIRTQQDVNDFNVKYGVNLVLPQSS
jgi:DNA-binding transcriptional regulator of glucitol operon